MEFSWLTFAFETANFLILLWLLQKLLFKPLKKGLDARRDALEARAKEAEQRLLEAEAVRDEVTSARDAIDEERLRVIRDAEEQAATERARLLESARDDAEVERHRAAHALDVERAEVLRETRELAVSTSVTLAGAILQQLSPTALHDALSRRLLEEIAQHGDRLAPAAGEPATLSVPPGAGEPIAVQVREALTRALGASSELVVEEDPELLAGARLGVGDFVVDASLAAHLDELERLALAHLPEVDNA